MDLRRISGDSEYSFSFGSYIGLVVAFRVFDFVLSMVVKVMKSFPAVWSIHVLLEIILVELWSSGCLIMFCP